jgi:hypothetical protein
MELLVATWTVRLAFIGALGVAGISLAAGSLLPDAVIRAAFVAFVFTFGGRQLIGFLETPEQRLARLRHEHAKRSGKAGKPAATAKPAKPAKAPKPVAAAAAPPAAAALEERVA